MLLLNSVVAKNSNLKLRYKNNLKFAEMSVPLQSQLKSKCEKFCGLHGSIFHGVSEKKKHIA